MPKRKLILAFQYKSLGKGFILLQGVIYNINYQLNLKEMMN